MECESLKSWLYSFKTVNGKNCELYITASDEMQGNFFGADCCKNFRNGA